MLAFTTASLGCDVKLLNRLELSNIECIIGLEYLLRFKIPSCSVKEAKIVSRFFDFGDKVCSLELEITRCWLFRFWIEIAGVRFCRWGENPKICEGYSQESQT
ncbi:hypothetical protein AAC387_Pa02g1214 [Persea americana]